MSSNEPPPLHEGDEPKNSILWHQSGVNPKGEAFIQIFKDKDVIAQLDPEGARDHARALLESAEAAEQDAFLFDFFHNEVGSDIQRTMMLIVQFRKYREARGRKGPPSDGNEFMRTEKHKKPPEGMK